MEPTSKDFSSKDPNPKYGNVFGSVNSQWVPRIQIPFLISGPSGIGKTYLMNKILQGSGSKDNKYNFKRVMSTTTRHKRERESINLGLFAGA